MSENVNIIVEDTGVRVVVGDAAAAASSVASAQQAAAAASLSASEANASASAAQSSETGAASSAADAANSATLAADNGRLGIGTVTTGAAGSPADATITGAVGSQLLNLTLPTGSDGAAGPAGPKGDPGASATTYASTTAGLAATTNGQYFYVPSTNPNASLDLYLNSSGSAVYQTTLPSANWMYQSDRAELLSDMPAGVAGLYCFDTWGQYPYNIVPNLVYGTAPELNLLRHPRRCYNNVNVGGGWTSSGFTTVTEDGTITGWDGSGGATRLTAAVANSGNVQWQFTPTLPAGTYTMAVWVRSRTGAAQSFFMRHGTTDNAKTTPADTTWNRYTVTFTLGAPAATVINPIRQDGGGGTLDIDIMDAKLYAGSVAPTDVTPVGHLYFGLTGVDTVNCVNGELDLTNGKQGDCEWQNPFTSGESTTIVIAKKVTANSGLAGRDSPFFFSTLLGSSVWSLSDVNGGKNLSYIPAGGQSAAPNTVYVPDNYSVFTDYRMIAGAGDSVQNSLWFDDTILYTTNSATTTTRTVGKFHIGLFNSSLPMHYKLYAIAFWPNRKLTGTEINGVYKTLMSRITRIGVTPTAPSRILCAEGDSITVGPSSLSYFYYYTSNTVSPTITRLNALSGSTVKLNPDPKLNLTYRASDVDLSLPPVANRKGRKFILTVFIGANDLQPNYSGNATNFLNDLWAYTDARRAAGWTVGVATILPKGTAQSGYAVHNTCRATVNPAILAAVGTHCDFTIDFAGDATMGPDAAANNVSLYSDGLHPTSTAHQTYLEPIYRAAVNAI